MRCSTMGPGTTEAILDRRTVVVVIGIAGDRLGYAMEGFV